MKEKTIRIGTRESRLALIQAETVQDELKKNGYKTEIITIKSDGDIDLTTPLYQLGITGIFTKTLDAALLSSRIDIAVHSMKDVPTQMALGISQAAVLKRGPYQDILIYKDAKVVEDWSLNNNIPQHPTTNIGIIATSSTRRKAQWLHRYPGHTVGDLRGNVQTRLNKLKEGPYQAVILALAGLHRLESIPTLSIDLDWMLPAPAQGAIMVVCKTEDSYALNACEALNHKETATMVGIERTFLQALQGGCTTPIGALAITKEKHILFKGNMALTDGSLIASIEKEFPLNADNGYATEAALELLNNGGKEIIEKLNYAK